MKEDTKPKTRGTSFLRGRLSPYKGSGPWNYVGYGELIEPPSINGGTVFLGLQWKQNGKVPHPTDFFQFETEELTLSSPFDIFQNYNLIIKESPLPKNSGGLPGPLTSAPVNNRRKGPGAESHPPPHDFAPQSRGHLVTYLMARTPTSSLKNIAMSFFKGPLAVIKNGVDNPTIQFKIEQDPFFEDFD